MERQTAAAEVRRVGRFVVVGVLGTLVHAAVFLAMITAGLAPAWLANVIGFSIAFVVSFTGQFGWTFSDRAARYGSQERRVALLRFFVVAVLGLVMNAGFVALVEDVLAADPRYAALFIVTVTPAVTFLLSRNWAFAPRSSHAPAPSD